MLNPNQAYKRKDAHKMMTEGQREVIERQCKEHNISLIRLTTRALGARKRTRDLTRADATSCILMAAVWENYRRAGDEP